MGIAGDFQPQRQALNPSARPWLPCPAPPGLGLDADDAPADTLKDRTSLNSFQVQALAESSMDVVLPIEDPLTAFAGNVTTAAANAVEACVTDIPISVYVLQDRRGWSIIIRVRAEDQDTALTESLLLCAQESIRQNTEQSGEACLLACRTNPFKAKTQGFTTILAPLGDRSRACWDFFATGQCSRARHCRWEHPIRKQRLCVVVKQLNEAALAEQVAGGMQSAVTSLSNRSSMEVAKRISGDSESNDGASATRSPLVPMKVPCDDENLSARSEPDEEENADEEGLPAKVLLDGGRGFPVPAPPSADLARPNKV